jgi:hypothetical protein
MHYERAAPLIGVSSGSRQEPEEKIGKSAEEWHFYLEGKIPVDVN